MEAITIGRIPQTERGMTLITSRWMSSGGRKRRASIRGIGKDDRVVHCEESK